MQIVCVESVCSDEKTTRFLDNAPGRLGIKGTVLFAPVQVQAEACAEADGAHDGPVRSAILVRHDANTGRIFVDEDMIRALVGALGEDVSDTIALAVIGERERQ